MKRHLTNAVYGVVDYVAYPLGMLLVAPLVLHRLGAEEYGIWTIATGVTSIGGIVASGFCDASQQRVARLRAVQEYASITESVRTLFSINLLLGAVLTVAAWSLAPLGAHFIAGKQLWRVHECTVALRLASGLILLRAAESVSVSTQRAFEAFGGTVRISACVRLLTLLAAAILALSGGHVVSMLAATGTTMAGGVLLQFRLLHRLLKGPLLWPSSDLHGIRALLRSGSFAWIQAVGGVIFGQLDRVMLGVALGAAAVAPYSLCTQFAHSLYGLTASALSFLFPYLAGRIHTVPSGMLRRSLWKAFGCNALLVGTGSLLLLVLGPRLLQAWAPPPVAHAARMLLPWVVLGSALMGMSVTAVYALLAMGAFRTFALINIATRVTTLMLIWIGIRYAGVAGLVATRAAYGVFSLLLYWPMMRALRKRAEVNRESVAPRSVEPGDLVAEGAKT